MMCGIRKKLCYVLSAIVAFVAVTSGVGSSFVYAGKAEPSKSDRIIVSLGDSYSSGEGILPFYGQLDDAGNEAPLSARVSDPDWLAHRSTKAWPGLLTLPSVGKMADNRDTHWFFVAASGAETKHLKGEFKKSYCRMDIRSKLAAELPVISGSEVLPGQLSVFEKLKKMGKKADYVTITIGGNDLGFADILTDVFLANPNDHIMHHFVNSVESDIEEARKRLEEGGDVRNNLLQAYKDIAEAAGEGTTILVVGYPELVNPDGYGDRVTRSEATAINKGVDYCNDKIEEIVKQCREENKIDIVFVPVNYEGAFKGHGAGTKEAYINDFILPAQEEDLKDSSSMSKDAISSSYSIHPNEKGARVYARCVQTVIDGLEEEKREERLKSLMAEEDLTGPRYQYSSQLAEDWQKAYVSFLEKTWKEGGYYEDENAYVPFYGYTVYDMDEDGIPELFIRFYNPFGMYYDDTLFGIYRYGNEEVECLDFSWERSMEHYMIPGNGIMNYRLYLHGKGLLEVTKTTLQDGTLVNEDLYFANLQDEDSDGEKAPEEIIEGASLMTYVDGNCYLPIFDYYGTPETRISGTNEEARKVISDTIQNGGTVFYCYEKASDIHEEDGVSKYHSELVMEEVSFSKLGNGNDRFNFPDSHICDTQWRDMNNDGQEECIVVYESNTNAGVKYNLAVSLQNEYVYVYDPTFASEEGYYYIDLIDPDLNKSLRFYKDQFYF